jgi:hypothetical protein
MVRKELVGDYAALKNITNRPLLREIPVTILLSGYYWFMAAAPEEIIRYTPFLFIGPMTVLITVFAIPDLTKS